LDKDAKTRLGKRLVLGAEFPKNLSHHTEKKFGVVG
jgi:hypothetical protein